MNTPSSTISSPPGSAQIRPDAPMRWLASGWKDLWAHPIYSLAYGAAFVIVGLALTLGLWALGISSLIPAVAASFMLVAPILAVGLYEKSRRLATGEPLTWASIVFVKAGSTLQLAYAGFFLSFFLIVWMRVAQLLFALFIVDQYPTLDKFVAFLLTTPNGLMLLAIGSIVGALIGLVVFASSVVSIPMMMDREVDVVTAMWTSLKLCVDNPVTMFVWAWLIALLMGLSFVFGIVLLVVTFPLIGHATWHAYREAVPEGPSGGSS